jgi:hypothetical protein
MPLNREFRRIAVAIGTVLSPLFVSGRRFPNAADLIKSRAIAFAVACHFRRAAVQLGQMATIDKPKPRPPYCRLLELSACRKRSKT